MAVIRNIAGEDRDIPVAGGTVKDGATFEVDDDTFHHYAFPESIYEVVEAPKSKPPATPDEPPAKSATKAEWAGYAVARGADPAAVEDLTKDQLIDQYGQE